MSTQQLISSPILINQYPIVKPKPLINNNDASSIKKSIVTPFSVKDSVYIYIGGAIFGVLFFIYKNRIYYKSLKILKKLTR